MSGKNSSNISRTNWAALEAMADDEIDYSDIPPLTEEFFEKATLRIPAAQVRQWVQIDLDVLKWFQSYTEEHKASINAALRRHIEDMGEHQQSETK
ncbi:MAG: BrnA antitoxin family protein [Leptolyngbyaceae cyanobacterium CSU_1_4]|nr:BrnA antitoxin family protein [Leptolyngbyaceae cyanobacterium CSU_1_4]